MRNPTRQEAERIVSALRKSGLDVRIVGSLAKKSYSDHDIDILLRYRWDKDQDYKDPVTGEYLDNHSAPEILKAEKVLTGLGFLGMDYGTYEGSGEGSGYEVSTFAKLVDGKWREPTVVDLFLENTAANENPTNKGWKRPTCIRCGHPLRKECYWYCDACGATGNPIIALNPLPKEDTQHILNEWKMERAKKKNVKYAKIMYLASVLSVSGDEKVLRKDPVWRKTMIEHNPVGNPMAKVHPLAIEARNRYREDKKAGHSAAAEYWRGQAGAFFTGNPIIQNPYISGYPSRYPVVGDRVRLTSDGIRGGLGTVKKVILVPSIGYHPEVENADVVWDSGGSSLVETKLLTLVARSVNANPIPVLTPIANSALAGIGLGIGFAAANGGIEHLTGRKNMARRKNPLPRVHGNELFIGTGVMVNMSTGRVSIKLGDGWHKTDEYVRNHPAFIVLVERARKGTLHRRTSSMFSPTDDNIAGVLYSFIQATCLNDKQEYYSHGSGFEKTRAKLHPEAGIQRYPGYEEVFLARRP